MIRFTNLRHKRIFATRIFDISETGISFATAHKYVPKIGEIVRMDFAAMGGQHIACYGKVVRIEEPTSGASWARFPDTVKVGVYFHQMHPLQRRTLSGNLRSAFERAGLPADDFYYVVKNQSINFDFDISNSWLGKNIWSVVVSLAIVGAVVYGTMYAMQTADERKPAAAAPWASGFFEKVRNK